MEAVGEEHGLSEVGESRRDCREGEYDGRGGNHVEDVYAIAEEAPGQIEAYLTCL